MAKLSVSFSHGRVAPGHDIRQVYSPNVDPTLSKYNNHMIYEPVEDAFRRIFGKAQEEYNERQSRKCRKIQDYYQKIKDQETAAKAEGDDDEGKKKKKKNVPHPEYEYVGQLGNHDTNPLVVEEGGRRRWGPHVGVSVKVYREFLERFQKRYPNLEITGFDIHLDEPGGTPHFHLRFVPVATGYKQGMDLQCSLTKALENLGYERRGRDDMQISRWRHDQMDLLTEIAKEHGIERLVMDNKLERVDVGLYKQRCKELELVKLIAIRDQAIDELKEIEGKLQELEDELERTLLIDRAKSLRDLINDASERSLEKHPRGPREAKNKLPEGSFK